MDLVIQDRRNVAFKFFQHFYEEILGRLNMLFILSFCMEVNYMRRDVL